MPNQRNNPDLTASPKQLDNSSMSRMEDSFLVLSLPPPLPPPPLPSSSELCESVIANDTAVGDGGDSDSLQELPLPPGLDTLPDVVLEHLFRMLAVRERGRLARTCHTMREIMHSASLWINVSVQLDCDNSGQRGIHRADLVMTQTYGEHFRSVDVVLHSLRPSALSIRRLRSFAERGVLKRVNLLVYTPDTMTNILKEPSKNEASAEELERNWCHRCDGIIDGMRSTCTPQDYDGCSDIIRSCHCLKPLQVQPATLAEVREMLTTNTVVTLQLTQTAINADFVLLRLYSATDKSKICQSVSTLILPEIRQECLLTGLCPRQSQTPTAVLISDFPNLQILQLSLHNLSEQLLDELSNTSWKRSQLKKLILLHKDFKIDMGRRFPSLSSPTWCQLTMACPGLAVECRVRVLSQRFPPLTDAIKPETPLVHLEVTVETDDLRDSECVQAMLELCRQHKCTFVFAP